MDIQKLRNDFPALHQKVYGRDLVYFDNAATTQKPLPVIESISNYYQTINSNVHRGVHHLSQQATDAFENTRERIKSYINAASSKEIIITKGATDSINLVANSFGSAFLYEGDEVIISSMEHHANIVPWQMICKNKGAKLKIIPLLDTGELDLKAYANLLNSKTKIVAVGHISNALGVVNNIREIIALAHNNNVPVMIDGAQGIVHEKIDVQDLDCDFYCFSSHKFYGPMGVGVLYGKENWLDQMPPYQTGGEMIKDVTFEKTTFNELPFKFETGTPNVADVIGFKTAIDYVSAIGLDEIKKHEKELMTYALEQLQQIPEVKVIAAEAPRAGAISFMIGQVHPYDAGTILDKMGVAVRTGNHCAQPLMDLLGLTGTIRASFAMYNEKSEIDRLTEAINKVVEMFA